MDEVLMTTTSLMLNTSFRNLTSSTDDHSQTTSASADLYHDVNYFLWLIVPPALLVLGTYGNVMTIVVMRAMRASDSIGCLSVYFTALAVSDLSNLWTNVVGFWSEMISGTPLTYVHDLSCSSSYFVLDVSLMTSAWFLVALTCQRMTSVVLPHRVEVLCTVRRGKIITAIIVIISCMVNLYSFFTLQVEYVDEGYPSCVSKDKRVANSFGFLYLCLASLIPFLLLIISNSVLIFGALQSVKTFGKMAGHGDSHTSSRLARVSSMTVTLILTSVAFLLFSLPGIVLWIYFDMIGYYEGDVEDDTLAAQLALADTVGVVLWLTNSSINFYIYILSGRKFRQEAKRYVCLCLTRQ